jgi:hypothetical protein
MAKHDPDDIYWNRYRERSLAEAAHHIRARKRADAGNRADKAEDDSSKPLASEVE